jgi:pepsin A
VTRVILNEIENTNKDNLNQNIPKADVPLHHVKDQLNDQYIGYIYLGNPPQKIKALFDTGSANMVVLTKNVDIGKKKTLFYDETKSTTYKESKIKDKFFRV